MKLCLGETEVRADQLQNLAVKSSPDYLTQVQIPRPCLLGQIFEVGEMAIEALESQFSLTMKLGRSLADS